MQNFGVNTTSWWLLVAILLIMDILHLKVGVLNVSYIFQPLMSFWYSWYYYIHFEITGNPCNLFGSQLSFRLIHVLNCFISVLNRNIFPLYQVISMSKTKWVLKAFLFSTFQQTRIFHSLNDIRLECVKLKRSGTVSHPEKFLTMAKFLTFEIKKCKLCHFKVISGAIL